MAVNVFKAIDQQRVSTAAALALASQRMDQGEPLLCKSQWTLRHDLYGRLVPQSNIRTLNASCSHYIPGNSVRDRLQIENLTERYSVPICAAGTAGDADFMGVSRNYMPQGLYGQYSMKGDLFQRTYNNPNNMQTDSQPPSFVPYSDHMHQPWDGTHDATQQFRMN